MNKPVSARRVLVVEDEVMVAWLLEDLLAERGYVIVGPTASVNQALAMIETEPIDVAVLDVNLKGKTAKDFAGSRSES